ncbi:hypothetical protein SAMN05421823_104105 [Catalinimonas alkaloidigena]|uniref:Uncharacterized protein n=1 Tax=Catalinimonas alkaloidigena TaxID=1075417 RepID=A0A1G9GHJ9_9BACT|nr:hypothetical protein [Catalinimonas alkaloidigena]SDK99995.1 hypothetical protein SAMN05421823_104105 [Catalinimonas alkaloidigena]
MATFGLHKRWFFYTDEWYVTDHTLAGCVGQYATQAEAQAQQRIYDRQALKNMGSGDYLRDLAGFFESNGQEVQQQLVLFARSQGWEDHLREHTYHNSDKTYFELSLPADATDAQLDTVLDITGASFHVVVEYKAVKSYAYIRWNYDFWGKKAFAMLKTEGQLDSRSPYIAGQPRKGYYLIHKPLKRRKTAKFPSVEAAWQEALATFLRLRDALPDSTFLGKHYVEDWSDEVVFLMAYLAHCQSLTLTHEVVTPVNQKTIQSKLRKLKSNRFLTEGMKFFQLEWPAPAAVTPEELQGLIELLRVKPFEVIPMVSEVNGQEIREYNPESTTF